MKETLLIELLTEELPPKALPSLSRSFSTGVFAALEAEGFTTSDSVCTPYATPRRLAVTISDVLARQPDRVIEKKGPALANALDENGAPNQALQGFMRSCAIAFDALQRKSDGKAEYFVARIDKPGESIEEHLAAIVTQTLKKLPIPKMMRWGESDHQFVRPVHSLILLHGARIVSGTVLGLVSERMTTGHRFLGAAKIALDHASFYWDALFKEGRVIASFDERRQTIVEALQHKAASLQARIEPNEGLIDEVTALVEWPVVYVGEFEREYLEIPQECLILTMQQNQKYFPLLDGAGKLTNRFLIVSNMEVADPRPIIDGNQRVVRPRLADARFFYTQDRKETLESRLARFDNVVYHNKLGTQSARIERLQTLAGHIASLIDADRAQALRCAKLAKADLLTEMVGEFPELQGIMGRYYALAESEDPTVADAIAAHYYPRFAGDELPSTGVACAVALADRIDTLVGFFGIGQIPTGDKDPYGLRRAALAVIRILCEKNLPLDLADLIDVAGNAYPSGLLGQGYKNTLIDFIHERLRGYLRDTGHLQAAIEAVLALRPTRLDVIFAKLAAVRAFLELPEAEALAAANKRIGNILKKSASEAQGPSAVLFQEEAEQALFAGLNTLTPQVDAYLEARDYTSALGVLASVRPDVDRFFDTVMVMSEDPDIRANRLGLLKALSALLNAVADISRLSR